MISFGKLHPQQSPSTKWLRVFFHKLKSITKAKKSNTTSCTYFDYMSSSFASMKISNQLKQVFNLIDFNGDGKISSLELGQLLARLGHQKSTVIEEADEILREADLNGDGFIDFDEFLHVVAGENDCELCASDEELMEAFRVFDVDKNGFISAEEIRRVLVGLGQRKCSLRQCKLMIRGVDKNGDGLVDFEEFKAMMTCGNGNYN